MRVGVRVHERRVAAALLHPDGTHTTDEVPVRGDGVEASIDRLLGRIARSAPTVSSIAFDVSDALHLSEVAPLTVVRIAPRPPVAPADEPRVGDAPIIHVRGGHTTLGEELAPFDAAGFRASAAA
ncbi:MAG TPA: hypothetical protein VN041_02655, partial [Microbacterium sp.]|nr:hypothetical protein [Microbacterium sp.]